MLSSGELLFTAAAAAAAARMLGGNGYAPPFFFVVESVPGVAAVEVEAGESTATTPGVYTWRGPPPPPPSLWLRRAGVRRTSKEDASECWEPGVKDCTSPPPPPTGRRMEEEEEEAGSVAGVAGDAEPPMPNGERFHAPLWSVGGGTRVAAVLAAAARRACCAGVNARWRTTELLTGRDRGTQGRPDTAVGS